ncbi:hypothetical protein BDF19DRAFT_389009 [Syncephalis fuscata]|nr:hypothetical protein BDF19DRAFT_389009 [Syncephalis fuscata]
MNGERASASPATVNGNDIRNSTITLSNGADISASIIGTSGNARILCLADIRGNLSLIDELADRVNAAAVIHTGDFGFFVPESLDRVDYRTIRYLVQSSPLLANNTRVEMLKLSPDLVRAQLQASQPFQLSQLTDYISGRRRFRRPVYVAWGACEDIAVLEKFRSGGYIVKNLKILDEINTHLVDLGGLHLRLLGLGGSIIRHKLFDHGDACAGTMAGGGGMMWTSLLQLGELMETASRVANPAEVRLLVTHTSPGKEPLVNQLALALQADYSISSGLHPRYPLMYTAHAVHPDATEFREQLTRARDAMLNIWRGVQEQVETQLNNQQRVLLDYALKVIHWLPSGSDEGGFKDLWCMNLPEAAHGQAFLEMGDNKISLFSSSFGKWLMLYVNIFINTNNYITI